MLELYTMVVASHRQHLFLSHILTHLLGLAIAQPGLLYWECGAYYGRNTSNTVYGRYLNSTLSSISFASYNTANNYGFYKSSAGQDADAVYAHALCRGDVDLGLCRRCVSDSILGLLQNCPTEKEAMGGDDNCMLYYSNVSVSQRSNTWPAVVLRNVNGASSVNQFNQAVTTLMDGLRDKAARGGFLRKVAIGEISGPDSLTIYGLVQCVPDLSEHDCWDCLDEATGEIPRSFIGNLGGRVIYASCNLRYEVERFYNASAIEVSLPSRSPTGISSGVIAGIAVAAVVGTLFLAVGFYVGFYRRKKMAEGSLLQGSNYLTVDHLHDAATWTASVKNSGPTSLSLGTSVRFSYKELAKATNHFSMANKIGQGGFGPVYYGELRGEKVAIKKMDMHASKEFLAELKVLTNVHHLNLVRLIGYCVEGSLSLVYEFIPNGNLSQHLRGSGSDPLPWSTRVQIALDSARGLEYIHEHTVCVYIHRDIKPANILIDKNFHAKVSDFGLAKLIGAKSGPLHTGLAGTFGYMGPEYSWSCDVSPKIDVYAFGVVLYELISAKEAVVETNEDSEEKTTLVALFENVLSQPNPMADLCKLVDPRLGDDYPIDSVYKMAKLARTCTHEKPEMRPSMKSIVVALMIVDGSAEDGDVGY